MVQTTKGLKRWMKARGMGPEDLARALGLPNPESGGKVTVYRWMRGARPFPSLLPMALKGLEGVLDGKISGR